MLSGAKSYQAIAQFGRGKGFALAHVLGFTHGKAPTKSTSSVLFRILDIHAFGHALSRWAAARLPAGAERPIALDGKTARGSRDGGMPGHHRVADYCAEARAVLAQVRVGAKTNEHQAALQLLGIVPVKGNIITGDALLCQRDLGAAIIAAGGDDVFTVKNNQLSLAVDIRVGLAFQEQAQRLAAALAPGGAGARAGGAAGGHGRRQGPRAPREADVTDDRDSDQAP